MGLSAEPDIKDHSGNSASTKRPKLPAPRGLQWGILLRWLGLPQRAVHGSTSSTQLCAHGRVNITMHMTQSALSACRELQLINFTPVAIMLKKLMPAIH